MKLRRFKAPSMREAIARVRAELGETAIIISTEDLPTGGVEVTAASERRASAQSDDTGRMQDRRGDRRQTTDNASNSVRDQLEMRLRARLRGEIRETPDNGSGFAASDIATILADHRVPELLSERIARAARAHQSDDAQTALAHGLDIALSFQPIGETLSSSVMLIGPPGAGKTVTAAKLAARAVLAGQQVDFITTDAVRSGALAQFKSFADILNQDVAEVRGPDELAMMLDTRVELGRNRPCIIDTPATNLLDRSELDLTARLVEAARTSSPEDAVEPIGVLAAGGDTEDMAEAAQFFAQVGCRRIIITRTDATQRLGGAIAALAASRLAAGGFGIKPYLAGGFAAATPQRLAEMTIAKSASSAPAARILPRRPAHAKTAAPGPSNLSSAPFRPDTSEPPLQ